MKVGVLLMDTGTPDRAASKEELLEYAQLMSGSELYGEYLDVIGRNMLRRISTPSRVRRWQKSLAKADADVASLSQETMSTLVATLEGILSKSLAAQCVVAFGLLYGNPSIEEAAQKLCDDSCDTIILMPLTPFSFKPLTALAAARARAAMNASWSGKGQPRLVQAPWLIELPAYRQLLAETIERDWSPRSNSRLLMLFPSQPKSMKEADATYFDQIDELSEHLAKKLSIGESRIQVSYLCDFDNGKWIGPFAEKTLLGWAGGAVGDVRVVCPVFVTDNLFVHEEVGERLREYFMSNSYGLSFEYELVPALAREEGFAEVLADAIQRALKQL